MLSSFAILAMQLHMALFSLIYPRFQRGRRIHSAHPGCKSNFRMIFFCELGKKTGFWLALYINTKILKVPKQQL